MGKMLQSFKTLIDQLIDCSAGARTQGLRAELHLPFSPQTWDPPASASQSIVVTGTYHHTQLEVCF